jgi:glycosyltransferase involved in cell wall biosynthesis
LVSVVVTSRNSARTLEACLQSIRAQTHPRLELVVVDNGSTDETVAIAGRYADRVARSGPERSAQRNHGAGLSTGPYLLFADSDMVLSATVVADCVDVVRSTGEPAAIIPEVSFGEGYWTRCRALERSCYVGDDAIEAARFFTREAFERSGGFDEAMTGKEDWDLSRRVAPGRSLPRTAAFIHHDEGRTTLRSAFRKRRHCTAGYVRYVSKHGGGALRQCNPLLRAAFARHWRELARHPMLTGGLISLKVVELAAVAVTALDLARRGGRVDVSGVQG